MQSIVLNNIDNQKNEIDFYRLKELRTKSQSGGQNEIKEYNILFKDMVSRADKGDYGARDILNKLYESKAEFSPEDMMNLVLSDTKNMDPLEGSTKDFLTNIMTVATSVQQRENSSVLKAILEKISNIEKLRTIDLVGKSAKFNSTVGYIKEGADIPNISIDSGSAYKNVTLQITNKSKIEKIYLGDIKEGIHNITDNIREYLKESGKQLSGNFSMEFIQNVDNKSEVKTNLKIQSFITQNIEDYDAQKAEIVTDGGIKRQLREMHN